MTAQGGDPGSAHVLSEPGEMGMVSMPCVISEEPQSAFCWAADGSCREAGRDAATPNFLGISLFPATPLSSLQKRLWM